MKLHLRIRNTETQEVSEIAAVGTNYQALKAEANGQIPEGWQALSIIADVA